MFGRLADVAGWRERLYDAQSVGSLRLQIERTDPLLAAELRPAFVTLVVNETVRKDDPALRPDDEVAFLPPMSGG